MLVTVYDDSDVLHVGRLSIRTAQTQHVSSKETTSGNHLHLHLDFIFPCSDLSTEIHACVQSTKEM